MRTLQWSLLVFRLSYLLPTPPSRWGIPILYLRQNIHLQIRLNLSTPKHKRLHLLPATAFMQTSRLGPHPNRRATLHGLTFPIRTTFSPPAGCRTPGQRRSRRCTRMRRLRSIRMRTFWRRMGTHSQTSKTTTTRFIQSPSRIQSETFYEHGEVNSTRDRHSGCFLQMRVHKLLGVGSTGRGAIIILPLTILHRNSNL
jgi:hypothetical protein